MTESELFTMMVGGMATIAGGVLAAYITMLGGADEAIRMFYAKHLLSASIMAAPATIVIAKIFKPETEAVPDQGRKSTARREDCHQCDRGGGQRCMPMAGRLALNVGGMLLAFIALIAMIDYPLGWIGEVTGIDSGNRRALSLSMILGYILSPLAWVIGVPWQDAITVGGLDR